MNSLMRQISPEEYEASKASCYDIEDIDPELRQLFLANFKASEHRAGSYAVQGLVMIDDVLEDRVRFHQVDDDGQPRSMVLSPRVEPSGLLGRVTLSGEGLVPADQGYLLRYGSEIDDEFAEVMAAKERELLPVHVSLGGAYHDAMLDQLQQQRERAL